MKLCWRLATDLFLLHRNNVLHQNNRKPKTENNFIATPDSSKVISKYEKASVTH